MLTWEQLTCLMMLHKTGNNLFARLPPELLRFQLPLYGQDPNNDIHVALRLAASGLQEDIDTLVAMVRANPRLLLQAGNVITRGGVKVIRTTPYEFFLGEGDPDGAKAIEFGFAELSKIKDEDGVVGPAWKTHVVQKLRACGAYVETAAATATTSDRAPNLLK